MAKIGPALAVYVGGQLRLMAISMDMRFPEFPIGRDAGPEPATRKPDALGRDFADYLEHADAPEEKPRPAETNKPLSSRSDYHTRPSHEAKESAGHDSDAAEPQDSQPADFASDRDVDPVAEGAPQHDTAAQPDTDDAAHPAVTPVAADLAPVADQAQPQDGDITLVAVPVAAPASAPLGADLAADATDVAQRPALQTAQAPTPSAPMPAAPAPADHIAEPSQAAPPATTAQPAPVSVEQPAFTAVLAAAGTKPVELTAIPPKAKSKTELKPETAESAAAPVAPAAVTTATTVPQVPAVAENAVHKRSAADIPPASTQTAAPPVPPQPVDGTAADGDAPIIALLASGSTAPSARPSDKIAAGQLAPLDPVPSDVTSDAKSAPTEQPKPEGPARPFGNLAPGLGLAAQITAQQTPEQANAADRLAQLVMAKEAQAPTPGKDGTEPAKAVEATGAPARIEQAPPADSGIARTTSVDAASAASAARNARPIFHPVIAQVAAHVAQAAIDGNDRINIRLSPAELGRIDVRLDFGPDGRVQAVFAADRAQTVDLLQRDARDLERALQDAGLRADSGSLSFNLRGDGRNGTQGDQNLPGRAKHDGAPTEAPANQVQAYASGSAGSGRLDIRI